MADNVIRTIRNARKYPVHECLINPSWKEGGLATILLSRKQRDGRIIFGVYLVDIFCLGLKNTYCNADFSLFEYEQDVRDHISQNEPLIDCPVPLVHHLIYGALDYASKLGFKPQKDFKMSRYILERKDKVEESIAIEFGKEGKPFYVAGPDDNVRLILRKLERSVGEGNFDFMHPMGEE